MRIEAVVVCHNYADFLEHTLPENMEQLDRLVVVTHPDDKDTQRICHKYSIDCIDTLEMHDEGEAFNKGRAINLGLMHLRHEGWLLQLDADILLPHNLRNRLRQAKLDTKNLYGADRLNVRPYEHFNKHKHKMVPQFQYKYVVSPNQEFPLASRVVHNEFGYTPIGFFQLWHSSQKRRYPAVCGSAEHSDVVFALQWQRVNRVHLPEFFVYHLDSEDMPKFGVNWKGRKTRPFKPK